MSGVSGAQETVTLRIDGQEVVVPKGTNLVEAAKQLGITIPTYCYHKHLTVAGNCRMCQVEIEKMPKLMTACSTIASEGMEVSTHMTSEKVRAAQASTLEFILINHPLDCTVCDQSGHCKLQDYHYEYNAQPSRLLDEKEHKVKAVPLGPNVILDGERCIMCTRCIRFCDEVTKTSEIGMLNRGDKSVISVNVEKPLSNALSGTVVDLCPVGALTHRKWRFNSRIWFTKAIDTICPGCSTGCNVKVHMRDGQIVNVKARENASVNKEWLCDEGRYGFDRFLTTENIKVPLLSGKEASWDAALAEVKARTGKKTLFILSSNLLLEEMIVAKDFSEKNFPDSELIISYASRDLAEDQKPLVKPNYDPNYRAAEFLGLDSFSQEARLEGLLFGDGGGAFENLVIIGEPLFSSEKYISLFSHLHDRNLFTIGFFYNRNLPKLDQFKVVIPISSVLEKSGIYINDDRRMQYVTGILDRSRDNLSAWEALNKVSTHLKGKLTSANSDRELTLEVLKKLGLSEEVNIARLKASDYLHTL